MLGKKVMQGLILIASFVIWDAWIKERFYSYVGDESLGSLFLGYTIAFASAFILGELTVRALGLNESEVREAY